MSADGAHDGITAEAALQKIIGGKEPDPTEAETVTEMRANLLAMTTNPNTYDGTARYAAKLVLEWLQASPGRALTPSESEYAYDDQGQMVWPAEVLQLGWYEQMKAEGNPISTLDLTGFMWGWAVNAARRCMDLPPVPNPAIMEI